MTTAAIQTEKRGAALEIRARPGRVLEGWAAVFDSPALIDGRVTEVVRSGAFRSTLASGRDVLALQDHDPGKLLARTRSGTLKLAEDSRGLHFELALPATTLGRDLLEMVERGDIGGASFAFTARDERWQGDKRELRAVDLYEVSIVSSWPAYASTSVQARGRQSAPDRLSLRRRYLCTCEGK
jgi:uncharacterized protein